MATLNPTPLAASANGPSHITESRSVNPAQHAVLLSEISINAGRIAHVAMMAQERLGDEVDTDVLLAAMHTMAQRVGWMAEIANVGLGSAPVSSASADLWLLPPIFMGEGMSGEVPATVGTGV